MKLTIMKKLLFVVALPVIALLLISANSFTQKYDNYKNDTHELDKLEFMKETSELLHEFQLERGLSSAYVNQYSALFFSKNLKTQKESTDIHIKSFKKAFEKLSANYNVDERILSISAILEDIPTFRENIMGKLVNKQTILMFYTTLNNELISILNSFNFHTNSQKTNIDMNILNRLIHYQEIAGQERALVSQLSYAQKPTILDLRGFYKLITSQDEEVKQLDTLIKGTDLAQSLDNIHKLYSNNLFASSREEIEAHELKQFIVDEIYKIIGYGGMIHHLNKFQKTKNKIFYKEFLNKKEIFHALVKSYISLTREYSKEQNTAKLLQKSFEIYLSEPNAPINDIEILTLYRELEGTGLYLNTQEWFKIATKRINDLHHLETLLFAKIHASIELDITQIGIELQKQFLFIIFTIISLLSITYIIARNINSSIKKLDRGINKFFDFLNFKGEKPANIEINSNDEICIMADNINKQMLSIEHTVENDKNFILEITQIVTLMKDGDFSQRAYFKPFNPSLVELKDVFDELIELISKKIEEQTDSLERLNTSLEDRVHHQTLELEKQIKDITIARDEAIKAEIAKDEFLANMSHEIRTPLNAILGFVTILKKRITEEKSLNYLTIIDTSGKSLLTIINDILDFSKIQSGKFTITPYNIESVDEFSNATLLFSSKSDEKHLIYAVYIDPSLPQTISVDAVRVKQILSNILSNAIKFTPEDGEIKVKVSIKDSNLIISVQDSGIGIAKENLSKVFSAFEQADGSTTREYGGTGLGLSISSRLASLMKGTLVVTSEVGTGSIFTLNVPIKIITQTPKVVISADKVNSYRFAILNSCQECTSNTKLIKKYLQDFGATTILELTEYQEKGYDILFFVPDDSYNEEIVNSNNQAIALLRSSSIKLANLDHIQPLYAPFVPRSIIQAINDTNIQGLNIIKQTKKLDIQEEVQFKGSLLIAEDNKTNQMLISLIVDDYGLEYSIANNGLEAVEMFKANKYDLVLMDENMPKLNGVEAMKQIKAYEEENSLTFTPIIALTASTLEADVENFLNVGMDGFVGKPIDNTLLEKEFAKYLKRV